MDEKQVKHLMASARQDAIYRELEEKRKQLEFHYQRILSLLPENDRRTLNLYVNAREGVESRLVRIAYYMQPNP